jgi:hypothetical protein
MGEVGARPVPLPHPAVAVREIDGEAVLLSPTLAAYRLDATAATIWRCLDGQGTLEGLAADLAAVYGAPQATVAADVDALVGRLGDLGFLATSAVDPAGAADADGVPTVDGGCGDGAAPALADPRHRAVPPNP